MAGTAKDPMNPDNVLIRVIVDDPCAPPGSLPQQAWFNVRRNEFRDVFMPLPRDRELPFAVHERQRASEQIAERQRAAEFFASQLTQALVEAFAKMDTTNGYSPQEWAKIHHIP